MEFHIKNLLLNENKIEEVLKKGLIVVSAGSIMMSFSGCNLIDKQDETKHNVVNQIEETDDTFIVYNSAIVDEDIKKLPSSIKEFRLHNCPFITNLDDLAEICPNIEFLIIDKCSSLTDLSFIYNMKNLKAIAINDTYGINYELIDYLHNKGITYVLDEDDIEAIDEIDRVLSEIITDDMTDEEKIRSIIIYVVENTSYDINLKDESNLNPLATTLKDKKGVCYGFSYTANVLMRIAGITSYQMLNDDHAWNMVELDGKYYYIDATNLGGDGTIANIAADILSKTGKSLNYLSDPKVNTLTGMSDYDAEDVVVPKELIEDIKNGESEKNIIERYSNSIPAKLLELILIIVALSIGVVKTKDIYDGIKTTKQKTFNKAK